jgi:hypothetical protein
MGSVTGKTVKIRRGPAAVTGDESRRLPLFVCKWEGAGIRLIREPEHLILTLIKLNLRGLR